MIVDGSIVHAALGRFAHLYPARLPDDPADALMRLAREVIGQAAGDARVAAFWLPRLARFASWFAETEPARRSETAQLLAEVKGERALDRPAGTFILTARADRIDVMADGRLVITDYKTMGASGLDNLRRRALAGRSPQLPLEAAIAEAGGFTGVAAATVARLVYISAAGSEPPGIEVEVREARQDSTPPATLAAAAVKGLEQLVAAYDDATTPYAAIRRPGFDYTYDAYGHLARVGEWSAGGEEE